MVEVQAPYGYVLDSEPVYFDVEQEKSEEESGVTIVKVERSNVAQKGKITVGKSGEVFSRVSGNKGLYQPIFAVDNLEGAVYEITAAEDIITTDGTVRAEKGEVVDTVTTGEDGTAESKELYLGKYEVKEITAPYGMVLSEEVHHPKAPNPYVCWYCKGGDNYYWGCYCNTLEAAREKLNERYQSECQMPYNQQPDKKVKQHDGRER